MVRQRQIVQRSRLAAWFPVTTLDRYFRSDDRVKRAAARGVFRGPPDLSMLTRRTLTP
jgi:hypothetical protein